MPPRFKHFLLLVLFSGCLPIIITFLNSSVFTQHSEKKFADLISNSAANLKAHPRLKERQRFSPETAKPSIISSQLESKFSDRREARVASHKLSEAEIAARFKKRRQILQTACRLHSNSSAFRKMGVRTVHLPLYRPVMNLSVTYCKIQKVSSTTWKSIFSTIQRKMEARGIAAHNVHNIPPGKRDVLFTFIREPYGRLLSAYVDKLFSPNTWFWEKDGGYIVEHFRQNVSGTRYFCGYDVTFPEFIKFFIHMQTTGQKLDGHFVPIHDHCHLCEIQYQYIGHLETFSEDAPFILNAMQSPVTYNKKSHVDTILEDVGMALDWMRHEIQKCMGLDEACRRIWKKWQIRGIISKTKSFPLTEKDTRNISQKDFINVASAASARLTDTKALAKQKKEALMEAFASIPLEDRREVQKLLFLDFEMFGFDPEPEEIFPREHYGADLSFSYFDLYK